MDILERLNTADDAAERNRLLAAINSLVEPLPNKTITTADLDQDNHGLMRAYATGVLEAADYDPPCDRVPAVVVEPAQATWPTEVKDAPTYSGGGHPTTAHKVVHDLLLAVRNSVPPDAEVLESPQIYLKKEAYMLFVMAWATYREAKR